METANTTLDKLDRILNKKITATMLSQHYKNGDYLYIDNMEFVMSYYSMEAVGEDKQQSRWVEYKGYGLTISLDFLEDSIEIHETL